MDHITVQGQQIPTTIIAMTDEPLTFVTIEYGGRTFRFSVRGVEAPYEVSYRHDFPTWDPETGQERYAWFPMSPTEASRGVMIQQYVYPQLLDIHHDAHVARRAARSA